jgi:hypothetical protein
VSHIPRRAEASAQQPGDREQHSESHRASDAAVVARKIQGVHAAQRHEGHSRESGGDHVHGHRFTAVGGCEGVPRRHEGRAKERARGRDRRVDE